MPTPICSAASMMRRFFGTAACTPFRVMLTVSVCSLANVFLRAVSDGGRRGLRAADQGQILVLELRDRAGDRRGGRIAQHTDRRAGHVRTDLEQIIQILRPAVAVLDAAQD